MARRIYRYVAGTARHRAARIGAHDTAADSASGERHGRLGALVRWARAEHGSVRHSRPGDPAYAVAVIGAWWAGSMLLTLVAYAIVVIAMGGGSVSARRGAPAAVRAALTNDAVALLRALDKGGVMTAARTFPFPHKFTLRTKGYAEQHVPAGRAALVIELQLVDAHPYGAPPGGDPARTDLIEYRINDRGREAAKAGTAWRQPAEPQPELFS